MKKTTDFLRTAGQNLAAAIIVLCSMTACSGDHDITDGQPTEQPTDPTAHTVCIHATMGDDGTTRAVSFNADGTTCTSTFSSTDRVYVYNAGEQYTGHWGMLKGYLTPTNISANGKSCDLVGTISGRLEEGETLVLAYNLNRFADSYSWNTDFYFDYETQTGAASTVIDGATAKVLISGYHEIEGSFDKIPIINDYATFTNVQSMFRQRLTFKDANNHIVTPTITSLRIQSRYSLVNQYCPMQNLGQESSGNTTKDEGIVINNPVIDSNGDIYLSLRFIETESSAALKLVAHDTNQNAYEIIKDAPEGGFKKGKYYHGSMALPLVRHFPTVTVTGTNTSLTPDFHNRYFIDAETDITISGNSDGYYFVLDRSNTVTLNDLTATYSGLDVWNGGLYYPPFMSGHRNHILVVNGTNRITCKDTDRCIFADQLCTLKLRGNGTLTVTSKDQFGYCGIYCSDHYNGGNNQHDTTDQEVNVSTQLAVEGYTVTRSGRKDNADGTYTWVYTVRPNQ